MIKYKLIHPNANFGSENRKTDGSVGYDLYTVEDVTITPDSSIKAHTGVCLDLTDERIFDCESNGYNMVYGQLVARSSLFGNYSVMLPNAVGIIDNDYQGEILVPLIYCGYPAKPSVTIPAGTAIAQLIFQVAYTPVLKEVGGFDTTSQRGSGGFGSTDDTNIPIEARHIMPKGDGKVTILGGVSAEIAHAAYIQNLDNKKAQERASYLQDHF